MATLYYSPSSCGAASFISAFKAGLIGNRVTAVEVNLRTHLTADGKNFYDINPKVR